MSTLVPTIIRLPEEELQKYKSRAAVEKKSFSALVREALQFAVAPVKTKKKKTSFWDVKKIAISGRPSKRMIRGIKEHDYYIYFKEYEDRR